MREIEPYKIKMVEPIRLVPRAEREAGLREAGFNVFQLPAASVYIDLLTDSGTGSMSQDQWAGIMRGDESYAGSGSFYRLRDTVREIFGYEHVIPTHQGRAAEHVLFAAAVHPGQIVPNNMHFDTTRAHVEHRKAEARDLVVEEAYDTSCESPFKGDIDVEALDRLLSAERHRVPLVMVTITNNSAGGQPVCMENIRETAAVCRKHRVPLFFDAARFAENSFFVKMREAGYADRTIVEIARETFEYGDGATMSAKKDGLVNIGGFVALRDGGLAERIRQHLILYEGFPTYGGMAGRDMEALAIGLHESTREDYLASRIGQIRFLCNTLHDAGVPVLRPAGGHAVYLDARRFAPHIPPAEFPAQALVCELYVEAGIRVVEVGSLMFGKSKESPRLELVRMAVPRRVYTNDHLMYVAEAVIKLYKRRNSIRGMRIVHEAPVLRHFTARLEPV
ncbi:MAG: tryptophanase [Acidobacteria bacterium]|nr:tryptophanase [Acidobacteriota bacterium]